MRDIIQGSSIHTERKEYEIEALAYMRFLQFKNKHFRFNNIYVADVFSGTGRNVINDVLVDGSPVRLMSGVVRANNFNIDVNYFFSDIRPEACSALSKYLLQQFKVQIATHTMQASDAINLLGCILQSDPLIFLFLVLDPNGPKDFPKQEVHDLLTAFPGRIDVIPNVSATAINRCLGARNIAGYHMQGWLGEIESFDEGFISSLTMGDRSGWIRRPIPGDIHRWVMVPTFGCFRPKNNWSKQGYVDLRTDEGRELVRFYCGRKQCK